MRFAEFFLMLCMMILVGGIGYFLYGVYDKFTALEHYVVTLESKLQECESFKPSSAPIDNVGDLKDLLTTATSSQLWLKLQKKLENTVVQVFVTAADYNILQPYQVPKPIQASGSGFIISKDGEIITNAHVINQATSIMVQLPAFGKRQFEVDLVGLMPEKDFALLKFKPEDREIIEKTLGKICCLPLGDSDKVLRAQEILALGYPLGQESLKSTTGVISGREGGMIQMSAPINPGSSGGPSINTMGEVVGINTAGIVTAQNVGYIIPINDVKIFLDDLRKGGLVRKPYIGVYMLKVGTQDLVEALGNPEPGGAYVVDVLPDSPLKGQLMAGDMIYEVNGIPIDLYGDMNVPWSEDKISTGEYISRLKPGQKVSILAYRKGQKKTFTCTFDRKELCPIRHVFVGYEELPFEAFGGFIVMPLMVNHISRLMPIAPGLSKYAEEKNQQEPLLVITHILPDSQAYRTRMNLMGSIIKTVNGYNVHTLKDLQKALADSSKSKITIITTDDLVVALDREKVIKQERSLAQTFGYKVTDCMKPLLDKNMKK